MSKTNFDPRAKAFVIGEGEAATPETTQEEESSASKSTFESVGKSQWKALTSADSPLSSNDDSSLTDVSSPLDYIGDAVSIAGDNLEHAAGLGVLGGAAPFNYVPKGKWDMQIKTPKKNAAYDYFQPVQLPTSFAETRSVFPDESDQTGLKSSIDQARSYYNEQLQMLKDRKASIESIATAQPGRFDGHDAAVTREFIAKLEKGIMYVEQQKKDLDEFEKDKINTEATL